MLPVVMDYDGQTYFRQLKDELLVGWFEKNARVFNKNSQIDFKNKKVRLTHDDKEHCRSLWQLATQRMPLLDNSSAPAMKNSPNNFTPDGRWIMGETADVKNYFVAVGMNGNSLEGAGGIGKAVAEWLIEGSPTQELVYN